MTITTEASTAYDTQAPELMDVSAVAEYCGVAPRTVRRWAERGEIVAPIRLGRRLLRWRRSDLVRWVAAKGEAE